MAEVKVRLSARERVQERIQIRRISYGYDKYCFSHKCN